MRGVVKGAFLSSSQRFAPPRDILLEEPDTFNPGVWKQGGGRRGGEGRGGRVGAGTGRGGGGGGGGREGEGRRSCYNAYEHSTYFITCCV